MGDRTGIQGALHTRWAGSATRAGSGFLVAVAALGVAVAYVVRRQPQRALGVLGGRGPVLFGARSPERQVAITIDDGPHARADHCAAGGAAGSPGPGHVLPAWLRRRGAS